MDKPIKKLRIILFFGVFCTSFSNSQAMNSPKRTCAECINRCDLNATRSGEPAKTVKCIMDSCIAPTGPCPKDSL